MTTRELAKNLDISEVTVRKYLKRLQEDKVLTIKAVVEPGKLGYAQEVVLHLRVNAQQLEVAAEFLVGLPEVRFLAITSGAYDIICTVMLRDATDLLRFLVDRVSGIDGLTSINTTFSLKTLKRSVEWFPFHDE